MPLPKGDNRPLPGSILNTEPIQIKSVTMTLDEKLAVEKRKLARLTLEMTRLENHHLPIHEHVIMNLKMRIIWTEQAIDSLEGDLMLENYTPEMAQEEII